MHMYIWNMFTNSYSYLFLAFDQFINICDGYIP